jgi:predicted RNA-binding protein YlqC (UPF0109 family)
MEELIRFIAVNLTGDEDSIEIETYERSGTTVYELRVQPADMGRVIGRHGRMAAAIRRVVNAAPVARGQRCILDIEEAT